MSYIITIRKKAPKIKHSSYTIKASDLDKLINHLGKYGDVKSDKKVKSEKIVKLSEAKSEKQEDKLTGKQKIVLKELKKANRLKFSEIGTIAGYTGTDANKMNQVSKIAKRYGLGRKN